MDKIDAALKPFLQKDVMFTFKHKNYKKGKLLLYKLSSNYLSFTVVTEKKRETFEIPYPFSVKTTETTVLFDYTLESLSEKDFELLIALKSVNKVKNSKFYDTILHLKSL
jgi:2-oxo-4-hydroxy-4-carboxy--5-ureidoimidazoline (OHCU) decarboxylase